MHSRAATRSCNSCGAAGQLSKLCARLLLLAMQCDAASHFLRQLLTACLTAGTLEAAVQRLPLAPAPAVFPAAEGYQDEQVLKGVCCSATSQRGPCSLTSASCALQHPRRLTPHSRPELPSKRWTTSPGAHCVSSVTCGAVTSVPDVSLGTRCLCTWGMHLGSAPVLRGRGSNAAACWLGPSARICLPELTSRLQAGSGRCGQGEGNHGAGLPRLAGSHGRHGAAPLRAAHTGKIKLSVHLICACWCVDDVTDSLLCGR